MAVFLMVHRVSSFRFLRFASPVVLLTGVLSHVASSAAQSPVTAAASDVASRPMSPTPIRIEGVVHVVGFDDKPGGAGDLSLKEGVMTFHVHGRSPNVPLDSIVQVSTAHGDKPLLNGAKEKFAQAAPYGIGFAVTMSRPRAEVVTLLYRDSSQAMHGAVLVLPKGSDQQIVSAMNIQPVEYPKTGSVSAVASQPVPAEPPAGAAKPDIEVALPSESIDGIPSSVPVTIYEEVIAQLTQSGLFAHVWRAGDVHRPAGSLILHLDLDGWKQGSARGRGFGPFTGATEIQSAIRVEDGSGKVIFTEHVKGSKRLNGESLEATNGLVKHV
ncbi:MAG TPA: hypothetical protein VGB69_09965, partial [Edaphobacter sp.]